MRIKDFLNKLNGQLLALGAYNELEQRYLSHVAFGRPLFIIPCILKATYTYKLGHQVVASEILWLLKTSGMTLTSGDKDWYDLSEFFERESQQFDFLDAERLAQEFCDLDTTAMYVALNSLLSTPDFDFDTLPALGGQRLAQCRTLLSQLESIGANNAASKYNTEPHHKVSTGFLEPLPFALSARTDSSCDTTLCLEVLKGYIDAFPHVFQIAPVFYQLFVEFSRMETAQLESLNNEVGLQTLLQQLSLRESPENKELLKMTVALTEQLQSLPNAESVSSRLPNSPPNSARSTSTNDSSSSPPNSCPNTVRGLSRLDSLLSQQNCGGYTARGISTNDSSSSTPNSSGNTARGNSSDDSSFLPRNSCPSIERGAASRDHESRSVLPWKHLVSDLAGTWRSPPNGMERRDIWQNLRVTQRQKLLRGLRNSERLELLKDHSYFPGSTATDVKEVIGGTIPYKYKR